MSYTSAAFGSPIKTNFSGNRTPTKAKTPRTPTGDRFIPSRIKLDTNLSLYQMCHAEEYAQSDTTPSKENYKSTIADTLFNTPLKGNKTLNFKNENTFHQDNSPLRLVSHMKTYDTPKKSVRQIPADPERILDAPNLVDDYYLNLLDWGAQNTLAIALSNSVYLWDAETHNTKHLLKLDGENIVTSLSFNKDGDYLAVGCGNAQTQIWNMEKGKMIRKITGHSARVSSLSWNNALLSSGSRDSKILNYDVRLARPIVSLFEAHTQEVCGLKWSPEGNYLASGGNDNMLMIWDYASTSGSTSESVPTAKPLHKLDHHQAAVKALAWCPWQEGLLASGGGTADRTLRFWNVSSGSAVCVNSIDTKSQVCAIQWSTTEKELVTSHGYSQNQLIVWKYPSLMKIAELKGHSSRVLHLSRSPDGKTIASAAGDDTLRFWKVFDQSPKADSESTNIASSQILGSGMVKASSLR